MRRVAKWLGFALIGIVGLAAIGAAYVYGASEYAIRRHYDIPLTAFAAPKDATAVERGKRVAILSGCYNGCHGKTMEGTAAFFNEPGVARINAPNLTRVLREYSDPELERLLRHGVKRARARVRRRRRLRALTQSGSPKSFRCIAALCSKRLRRGLV